MGIRGGTRVRAHHTSVVVAVLIAALTACSTSDEGGGTPTSPTPPTGSTAVVYTAIGASDAAGVGASVPCVPFASDCRSSTGYVGLIQRRLADSRTVTLTNLALPGAVLGPDVQALGNELGRGIPGNFLTHLAPFVPAQTTLVTVFAGGNDTNTIASAIGAGRGGSDPSAYLSQQVQAFARDYGRLLDTIRNRAPSSFVVVLNLPNLSALPYVANRPVAERRVVQEVAVRLTREAINPLASRVPVVDVMCDARSYQPGTYSPDGFHPNDQGHAYLAEILMAVITSGTAPAPAASCGFMSLVG